MVNEVMFKSKLFLNLSKIFNSTNEKSSLTTSEQKAYITYLENNLNILNKKLNSNSVENNTISFQLGNALIQVMNGKADPKDLPKKLMVIYGEARRRKYKNILEANELDRLLILFSNEKFLEKYIKLEQANKNSEEFDIKSQLLDIKNESSCTNSVLLPHRALTFSEVRLIELENIRVTNEVKEITVLDITSSSNILHVSSNTVYKVEDNVKTRKSIILMTFLDILGNRIESIPGLSYSAIFNSFYRYLNANSDSINKPVKEIFKIELPENVRRIKLSVAGFKLSLKDEIDVKLRFNLQESNLVVNKINNHDKVIIEKSNLKNSIDSENLISNFINLNPIVNENKKIPLSSLNVAAILDEFTSECLSHEFNLIKITQEKWREQVEEVKPDFLLVESCWRGNDGNWGTLTKGSGAGKKLSSLLKYCKENSIPTVFWNKEDPPHYEKFGAVATIFDIAITTDINMVPEYKKDFGIDVYPLSFAAQPTIHNPLKVIDRTNKAVFAGSYYSDKPKRCLDFKQVLDAIEVAGIDYDIFDRNYYRDIEKFAFPSMYQNHIVGNLPPEELWKVHKGYKYQINMNTVQDSSTMFARRVYESLASGTLVVSNYSLGVSELFKDLVIMDSENSSIADRLKELESSPQLYNDLARKGVRCIMREHTYGHRIQEICKLIGIDVELSNPMATLAVTVRNENEILEAKQLFDRQTALSKHLFIEMENFFEAHNYLNQSNHEVTYAMKLGKELYREAKDYYGNSIVLETELIANLTDEALEDFIYWGNCK